LGLVEFCYNFTKHLAIKTNPSKLALGVEAKQPMDLAILEQKALTVKAAKRPKQ
jgi:hypothetical protein